MDILSSRAADANGATRSVATFGPFALDLDAHRLTRNGAPVSLQLTPLKILAALVRARGTVVSQETLCESVWSDRTVDFERSLHTAVKQARQALGDDARHPRYIQTEPRRGYRFVAPVSIDIVPTGRSFRRVILWAAAAAAVLLILFGLRETASPSVEARTAHSIGEGQDANRLADREQRHRDREARRLRRAAAIAAGRPGQ